jgi:hypothetical protein
MTKVFRRTSRRTWPSSNSSAHIQKGRMESTARMEISIRFIHCKKPVLRRNIGKVYKSKMNLK